MPRQRPAAALGTLVRLLQQNQRQILVTYTLVASTTALSCPLKYLQPLAVL